MSFKLCNKDGSLKLHFNGLEVQAYVLLNQVGFCSKVGFHLVNQVSCCSFLLTKLPISKLRRFLLITFQNRNSYTNVNQSVIYLLEITL